MTDQKICGYEPTTTGEPCENSPSESDGWCWVHTGGDDQRGHRKLSHERQENIALAIEEGVPVIAACRLNGITHKTHRRWMELGEEQDEGPYAEYCQRLVRALGHDQRKKTQALWDAAEEQGNTGAMLTILKQRYPETWGQTDIGESKGGLALYAGAPDKDDLERHLENHVGDD